MRTLLALVVVITLLLFLQQVELDLWQHFYSSKLLLVNVTIIANIANFRAVCKECALITAFAFSLNYLLHRRVATPAQLIVND